MTGISFREELNIQQAQAGLQQLIALGTDLEPLMDEIGGMLVTSTQMRFERGVGPDGTPWKPSIRAQEQGGKTLVDTARLMSSLTHAAHGNAVEVGTNVVYAAVHQLGATIAAKVGGALRFKIGDRWVRKRSVKIPARPYLGINREDESAILEILAEHVAEAASAPGEGS